MDVYPGDFQLGGLSLHWAQGETLQMDNAGLTVLGALHGLLNNERDCFRERARTNDDRRDDNRRIFSVVHAFMVRNDYVVRLVLQTHQAFEEEISRRRASEEEYRHQPVDSPTSKSSEESPPIDSPATEASARDTDSPETATESLPTAVPGLVPVEIHSEGEEALRRRWIPESYPLPLAYSLVGAGRLVGP